MSALSEFEVWSRALKQVLPEAEKRMDVRPIITKLDSNNLLNYYEYDDVDSARNRIEKTRKVFHYIANKDTMYIHKFVYILENSSGFEHWAKAIKECAGIPVTEVVGSGSLTPAQGGTPSTPAQPGGELGTSGHNLPTPSHTPTSHPSEAFSRLGEKPKKREVLNVVVPKIAHEWKYIAVQLEIEEEADQINQDYQKVKDKCYHVIVAWLDGKGRSDITWNTLLSAIDAQGFHDFAEELKHKLAMGEELC